MEKEITDVIDHSQSSGATKLKRSLVRPFNVLGCTLERNQLRHCAAKPIVQLAIIANTSGFLHQSCFDPGTN